MDEVNKYPGTFISKSLDIAPTAVLACSVLKTKWPVKAALIAISEVS